MATLTRLNVIIPETINGFPATAIGENAFEWRADLTSITIPDGVTSIGDRAGDEVVDRNDLSVVVATKNRHAVDAEDPRDLDGDGLITVLDARILVTLFSVPGGLLHAASSPEGVVPDWAQSAGALKLQSNTDLQSGIWQDVGGLQRQPMPCHWTCCRPVRR